MRKLQKHLPKLVLLTVLLYLLYTTTTTTSNQPKPKNTIIYPWRKIKYVSPTTESVPENGVCKGLKRTSKPALVVSRVESDGDETWLDGLRDKYHICLYHVPSSSSSQEKQPGGKGKRLKDFFSTRKELTTPANKGHESMAYLTFLIENYDNLPANGIVFVHGSRLAWHNDHPDYDNVALLRDLDIPSAVHETGYHNLRCDWSLSTCPASVPPQGGYDTAFKALLQPWSLRAVSDAAMPRALEALFGPGAKLGRRHTLRAQCCAQFVVRPENVRRHSREEYVALRRWLLDAGVWGRAAPLDDRVSGRVLSYLWHVLFLGDGVDGVGGGTGSEGVDLERLNERACPSVESCYCKLYGRCGLVCGTGSCGVYRLPEGLKVGT